MTQIARTRIDRFKVTTRVEALGFGRLDKFAEEADLGAGTIYSVLDSYSWSSKTLDKIAHALGCAPFDILTVDVCPN